MCSVWTIDLATLLKSFGVELIFLTTTMGANPDFASVSFYVNQMLEDEYRVNKLFKEAPLLGIPVYQCSLVIDDVKRICLSGVYAIIALVEKGVLWRSINWGQRWVDSLCGVSDGYVGHYVVVCGCDSGKNEFLIKDPAISNSNGIWVKADDFDNARRSFGTDEDMLIVSLYTLCGLSTLTFDLKEMIANSTEIHQNL